MGPADCHGSTKPSGSSAKMETYRIDIPRFKITYAVDDGDLKVQYAILSAEPATSLTLLQVDINEMTLAEDALDDQRQPKIFCGYFNDSTTQDNVFGRLQPAWTASAGFSLDGSLDLNVAMKPAKIVWLVGEQPVSRDVVARHTVWKENPDSSMEGREKWVRDVLWENELNDGPKRDAIFAAIKTLQQLQKGIGEHEQYRSWNLDTQNL